MEKEVSIVLSQERKKHRKLAQEWYGLTDEQMRDCDVHHNPPRSEGGRNIPEHLYVYHFTLHDAVHGDDFTKWARTGAKHVVNRNSAPGGRASMVEKNEEGKCVHGVEMARIAHSDKNEKGQSKLAVKMGKARAKQSEVTGYSGLGSSKDAASLAGKKAASQRWICLKTGHISSAGPLTLYQKARNIDTSLRKRIL
jgi:hypothetical protein